MKKLFLLLVLLFAPIASLADEDQYQGINSTSHGVWVLNKETGQVKYCGYVAELDALFEYPKYRPSCTKWSVDPETPQTSFKNNSVIEELKKINEKNTKK